MSGGPLGNTGHRFRTVLGVFRTLSLGLAAAILSAGSCKDNLGKGQTGPQTFRVSVGPNDLQANGVSTLPLGPYATSSDGRYVVFQSVASNLTIPSLPGVTEVFVRDRFADVVENISQLGKFKSQFFGVTIKDATNPAISPDGRYVAFVSDNVLVGTESTPQSSPNIFFFDRLKGKMTRVLKTAWPDSFGLAQPSIGITADGRPLVAFESQSGNLGFSNPSNLKQVYVADMSLATPTITLVSHDNSSPTSTVIANQSAGVGQISADGTTVSFTTNASNLGFAPTNVEVFVGTISGSGITVDLISLSGNPGMMANGDCFHPALSADGRFAAFITSATNLVPSEPALSIVVRDRNMALTTLAASDPDGIPIIFGIIIFDTVSISGDGRFVVYHASTDSQIYVRDMEGGFTLVSRSTAGAVSNNALAFTTPVISGDGRWVFWNSDADNLVSDDTNSVQDVFGRGPLQ